MWHFAFAKQAARYWRFVHLPVYSSPVYRGAVWRQSVRSRIGDYCNDTTVQFAKWRISLAEANRK